MIDETVEEIAEMQTHSSSVVAVKAAQALSSVADREYPSVEEYVRALERNSRALRRANPSHASLHTTQREIVERVEAAESADVDGAIEATREIIEDITARIETAKREAGERAAPLLAEAETVLTHDYSSTVLAALEETVIEQPLEVYVTEARPRYLGRKMARTLGRMEGVEARLVVDSAAGHVLSACDRVVVGMDCIVEDTLYNRVGTYPIAATAADVGVPVTVVGSAAKLIEGGFAFENEERSVAEVMREPAEGFAIGNPAYDATPTRLLDSVVTDRDIIEY
jgi:translation initiation factor eIF-2B subunit delta